LFIARGCLFAVTALEVQVHLHPDDGGGGTDLRREEAGADAKLDLGAGQVREAEVTGFVGFGGGADGVDDFDGGVGDRRAGGVGNEAGEGGG
jgi:hypothetical protein